MKMVQTPDYFTLRNFIQFLQVYQPEGEYPYNDHMACVIAHFMMAQQGPDGPHPVIVNKKELLASADMGQTFFEVPEHFAAIAKAKPHTYPAALERAEHFLQVQRIYEQFEELEETEAEAAE